MAEAVINSYPNDLTTLPGGEAAPVSAEGGHKNKRKQTLLSLLDALQELSKDEELNVPGVLLLQRTCTCSCSHHATQRLPRNSLVLKEIGMSVSTLYPLNCCHRCLPNRCSYH